MLRLEELAHSCAATGGVTTVGIAADAACETAAATVPAVGTLAAAESVVSFSQSRPLSLASLVPTVSL
jgi:hypothetical protein